MKAEIWIQLTLIIALSTFIVFYAIRRFKRDKANGKIPNFRIYFIVGLICMPLGIIIKNYPLSAMGLILSIVGIANRKYWMQTIPWAELNQHQRTIRIIISLLSIAILALGIWIFLIFSKS